MRKGRADLRRAVKTDKEGALDMLVDLFDWLDGLEPQPTANIVSRYQSTLIPTNQAVATGSAVPSYPHRTQLTPEEGQELQEKMQGSSEQMKGTLWLLKMAKKMQEGVRKVMLYFTGQQG